MQASWHESTMPPPFYKLTCSSSCVWERALLMQVHPCPVCKLEVGLPRMVPKTALRAREEFLYFECEDCGCLFLPESDGSMEETEPVVEWTPKSGPAAFVRRLMAGLHLWPPYMKAACMGTGDLQIFNRARLTKKTCLLDIGPGASVRVQGLREAGYDAHGLDVGSEESLAAVSRMMIGDKWPNDIPKMFDLIVLRHALERLPIQTLAIVNKHINLKGCCVACVVLLGWAWRTYGTHWAQLNPPFHRLIHSSTSFSLLARESGFRIGRVVFDSNEGQIWSSDALQQNVPLTNMPTPTRSQRARMRRIAEALNLRQQGDSAQFYLYAQ